MVQSIQYQITNQKYLQSKSNLYSLGLTATVTKAYRAVSQFNRILITYSTCFAIKEEYHTIPENTGSSRIHPSPVDSRFVHQHIYPYLQDTQHHRTTLLCSQPLHSMTESVKPGYKFLQPRYMCSRWDNSASCPNNKQPATAASHFASAVVFRELCALCSGLWSGYLCYCNVESNVM